MTLWEHPQEELRRHWRHLGACHTALSVAWFGLASSVSALVAGSWLVWLPLAVIGVVFGAVAVYYFARGMWR